MRTPISNLMTAHRAVLEGTQEIGLKGVEIATRFFDLQTQAAQGMLVSGSDAAHGGPPDAVAMARGAAEYTQRAISLAWQTHAEITELLNRQISHLQTLFGELMSSATPMAAMGAKPPEREHARRMHAARPATESI